jgi:hypothetical protein
MRSHLDGCALDLGEALQVGTDIFGGLLNTPEAHSG